MQTIRCVRCKNCGKVNRIKGIFDETINTTKCGNCKSILYDRVCEGFNCKLCHACMKLGKHIKHIDEIIECKQKILILGRIT